MKTENISNPFLLMNYVSPEYFCDREEETGKIIGALENGRNVTLISIRRIGKTGLIKNVFYHLSAKGDNKLIYLDVMPVVTFQGFVETFGSAVMNAIEPVRDSLISKVLRFFTNLKPVISVDALTAQPSVELKVIDPQEVNLTLDQIFNYLEKETAPIYIAIDEFQQLADIENGSLVALLRSWAQKLNNVRFIFSGSKKHMLIDIFVNPGGVFFRSTDILNLELLDKQKYSEFIEEMFHKGKIVIDNEALDRIFLLTRGHTFYVQYLCNRLYATGRGKIEFNDVNSAFLEILRENDGLFSSLFNLLAVQQKMIIKAVADEGETSQPYSSDFIRKHNLSAASSVRLALNALISKEMVYEENGFYYVYDVFFSEWLKRR